MSAVPLFPARPDDRPVVTEGMRALADQKTPARCLICRRPATGPGSALSCWIPSRLGRRKIVFYRLCARHFPPTEEALEIAEGLMESAMTRPS